MDESSFSPELKEFLDLLERKEKMVAMLAPSFPVDFEYPQIAGKLKRLGFNHVIEVSRGAMELNQLLLELLKSNPSQKYITSPCPTIVRLIRNKYPHLKKFLAPIGSPMSETAKLAVKKFPGHRFVFIGPCLAKKIEAKEDWSDLKIIVLTYRELEAVFEMKNIKNSPDDVLTGFDEVGIETRLYPISGGLSQSAGLTQTLTDEEYDVVSGPKLVEKALTEFPANRLKILDILYCDGGCIAGPGISSKGSLDERRKKIISHWARVAGNKR